MKKITLIISLGLFGILSTKADSPTPVVTAIWQKTAATTNLPKWFSITSGKTRNIGLSGDHLYVASRDASVGNVRIMVYNSNTGDSITSLSSNGISGGAFVINDVGCTEDGKIITSSLANTTEFKIYQYDTETIDPTVILNTASVATMGGRTGDYITITGKISDGTAKIWTATNAKPSLTYVLEMENTTGSWTWKADRRLVATMTSDITAAGLACVAVKPDGSLFWKAAGQPLKLIAANGTVGTLSAGFSPYSHSIKYLGYSQQYNLDYIAVYCYTGECAQIVSMAPGDLSTCKLIASTTKLGSNANNNGNGDVEFKMDENNNPVVYVHSTSNGFGAYKIEGLAISVPTEVAPIEKSAQLFVYPNPATDIIYLSETATTVKLFTLTGQLVKKVDNTNQIDVKSLRGIYMVEVATPTGKTTKRVSIK